MGNLWQFCKAMIILGCVGMLIGFVSMIGAMIARSPLWVGIAAGVLTVTTAVIVGKVSRE